MSMLTMRILFISSGFLNDTTLVLCLNIYKSPFAFVFLLVVLVTTFVFYLLFLYTVR